MRTMNFRGMVPHVFMTIFLCLNFITQAQIAPIQIGRASNLFTSIREEQNQVIANQDLNTIAFIHRQDVTLHGGGSAWNSILRYDISTDGGKTFTADVGMLNWDLHNRTRNPQAAIYNPAGNNDPDSAKLIWTADRSFMHQPGSYYNNEIEIEIDLHSAGFSFLSDSIASGSRFYLDSLHSSGRTGGLTAGKYGEFWMASWRVDDSIAEWNSDSLRVFKGAVTNDTAGIAWELDTTLHLPRAGICSNPWDAREIDPNMGFSPDGKHGWIAYTGDLLGGHDSTFSPILIHSSDSGKTWGSTFEVDLRNIPWLKDSLQSHWLDTNGDPVSSGKPHFAWSNDLVVDAFGHPHFFGVVGTAADYNGNQCDRYSIQPSLWKGAIDLTTTDFGQTWKANLIAPVLAFRGYIVINDPNGGHLINMDNWCQVSRTTDGTKIFYTWIDSDTNKTGYGNQDNSWPDLMTAGYRITDGYQTCWRNITKGDLIWEGNIFTPTTSPITLEAGSFYRVPVVVPHKLQADPLGPTQYYYFGNDVFWTDNDFKDPSTINLSWNDSCYNVVMLHRPQGVRKENTLKFYPNPAKDILNIEFTETPNQKIEVEVFDVQGRLQDSFVSYPSRQLQIETRQLAKGLHVARVKFDRQQTQIKFLVE